MIRTLQRAGAVLLPGVAVVAVQKVLFPLPAGVWLQGAILGLLGAMMAVGLGLVHRLDRVVNFAQGDLGSAPTVLAYGLIGLSGVDYFVGFATGLVATVVLAVAVQVLVVRRFNRAPRLVLTVATIGLSQALVVVSLLVPDLWGSTPITTAVVHVPWHLTFEVAQSMFNGDYLVALIVAPLALLAVALWSQRATAGIAARAAGDRRDRAAMLGIPVNRIQTTTWVVAAVLSFLSVFLRAAILGLPLDPTFSLEALVTALGALALGGFTDLVTTALAAVALGVLEQGVAWNQQANPTLVLAVVAAVVLVAMVAPRVWDWSRPLAIRLTRRTRRTQRTQRTRHTSRPAGSRTALARPAPGRPATSPRSADTRQWLLASSSPDLPRDVRGNRRARLALAATGAALLATLATLPAWMGPGELLQMSTLLALAVVGCSLVVLTGWGGQVSLAQMSFAAVGGVAGAVALADWHWDLSLALVLAGAAGGAVAVAVGLPTLRLDGVFSAVTTLAFGLAASGYLLDRAQFSWIPAAELPVPALFGARLASQPSVYLTCLGVGVLTAAGVQGLRHSRFGRVLRGIATNEPAARAYGVATTTATVSGFAVSGLIAGVAGCLLVVVNQQYVESPFDVTQSLAVFTATAVGGLSSVTGAVAGAALVEGSTAFLPPSWQPLPAAAGVLLVLLLFPQGVAGLLSSARDRLLALLMGRPRSPTTPPTPPTPPTPSSPAPAPAPAPATTATTATTAGRALR